jgi:arylsulfatase A-like enzyme
MEKYEPQRLELRPNVARSPTVRERVRRDLAGYYAMIENLDWNYGRVIQTLEQMNLLFHTHVLFFADHGDMHGSHGLC